MILQKKKKNPKKTFSHLGVFFLQKWSDLNLFEMLVENGQDFKQSVFSPLATDQKDFSQKIQSSVETDFFPKKLRCQKFFRFH